MKVKQFILYVTCFLLLFSFKSFSDDNIPKFTILSEHLKPYNFVENGKPVGISVDILLLLLEKVGSDQNVKDINLYPWARSFKMAQEQSNTILFTTARIKHREELFKWVGPIFSLELDFYALKNKHIEILSLSDLRKYKIGTVRGDATEDLLIMNTRLNLDDFQRVASNLINTRKLMFGRIDLMVQIRDSMLDTCIKEGIDPELFEKVFKLTTVGMYYAFNKDTPDIVIKKFQGALDQIKAEGIIDKIFKDYQRNYSEYQ